MLSLIITPMDILNELKNATVNWKGKNASYMCSKLFSKVKTCTPVTYSRETRNRQTETIEHNLAKNKVLKIFLFHANNAIHPASQTCQDSG